MRPLDSESFPLNPLWNLNPPRTRLNPPKGHSLDNGLLDVLDLIGGDGASIVCAIPADVSLIAVMKLNVYVSEIFIDS